MWTTFPPSPSFPSIIAKTGEKGKQFGSFPQKEMKKLGGKACGRIWDLSTVFHSGKGRKFSSGRGDFGMRGSYKQTFAHGGKKRGRICTNR